MLNELVSCTLHFQVGYPGLNLITLLTQCCQCWDRSILQKTHYILITTTFGIVVRPSGCWGGACTCIPRLAPLENRWRFFKLSSISHCQPAERNQNTHYLTNKSTTLQIHQTITPPWDICGQTYLNNAIVKRCGWLTDNWVIFKRHLGERELFNEATDWKKKKKGKGCKKNCLK